MPCSLGSSSACGTTARRSSSPSIRGRRLREAFAAAGAARVGIAADLDPVLRPSGFALVEDDALAPHELDGLDGALTTSAAGCAETGTIALDGRPGQGRRALSLVPDLHVCIVRAETIVETVPELIAALEPSAREGRPIVLVSGPSATSDIELQRVEGVHGPRRLVVIVATCVPSDQVSKMTTWKTNRRMQPSAASAKPCLGVSPCHRPGKAGVVQARAGRPTTPPTAENARTRCDGVEPRCASRVILEPGHRRLKDTTPCVGLRRPVPSTLRCIGITCLATTKRARCRARLVHRGRRRRAVMARDSRSASSSVRTVMLCARTSDDGV